MSKLFLLPLAALSLCAGCSQNSSTIASAQVQRTAAQAVVDKVTGNARGSRNQARELRAESDNLLAAKDYDGAMAKRLEMLAAPSKATSSLGALTSYAIQPLALRDLSTIASHLDAASCRKYADQLAKIDSQNPSYAVMLQSQKASQLKDLASYSSNQKQWDKLIGDAGFSEQQQQTLRNTSIDQIKTNITAVYDAEIVQSSRPYSFANAPVTTPIDPYTELFATPSPLKRFLWTKAKTERLLTIVALRQRADQLDKKSRTWSLPADPFGTGPLKAKGTLIYSVGPNTKDDGGKAVPNVNIFQPNDKGDIPAPTF